MIKNSKQRAYLKGLAMNMTPIIQIGKSSVTPELTQAVEEALLFFRIVLMIRVRWQRYWLNVHMQMWFRLSAKRLFFIKKARTTKRKLFFLRNNIRQRRCLR